MPPESRLKRVLGGATQGQKRVLGGATRFFGSTRGCSEEQRIEKQGTWRSRFLQNRVPGGAAHNITSKTGYLEEQPHGKTGYLEE